MEGLELAIIMTHTATGRTMAKSNQQSRPGWGGKRPGAGAPLGNTNAVKHGERSRRAFSALVGGGQLPPLVSLRASNLMIAERVGELKAQLTKVNQEKAQRQEEANKKREGNPVVIHQRKIAEINKRYGLQALALIHEQQITYAAGNRLIMNGRPLSMNEKEFGNVLYRTFERCEGFDAYIDAQGVDDICRKGVIEDVKAWIALSKDKTISNRAWAIGHSKASTSSLPGFGAVSFRHWVGMARVSSSRGY